jgi:ferredoxin-NADP reductase
MMKFLIDKNQKRDIIQLYANRNAEEIAYADVFEEALKKLNIPTYYVLSRPAESWQGISGHLDENIIIQTVPDFLQRTFYISGSHNMVEGVKKALLNLGVSRLKIKTDFFPGLA